MIDFQRVIRLCLHILVSRLFAFTLILQCHVSQHLVSIFCISMDHGETRSLHGTSLPSQRLLASTKDKYSYKKLS